MKYFPQLSDAIRANLNQVKTDGIDLTNKVLVYPLPIEEIKSLLEEIDRLTAENARMREGIEVAQGNLHRFAILHHANELHGKAILSEAYETLQSALNGGK